MLQSGIIISLCYFNVLQEYIIYIAEGIWINALFMLVAKILRQEVKQNVEKRVLKAVAEKVKAEMKRRNGSTSICRCFSSAEKAKEICYVSNSKRKIPISCVLVWSACF